MENLVFCLNALMPIYIMILLGNVALKRGLFDKSFADAINSLAFKFLLPMSIFKSVYNADFKSLLDLKLMGFCLIGSVAAFIVIWVVSSRIIKDPPKLGSFIQGCIRGNFIILGIQLVEAIFGEKEVAKAAMVSPVVVTLFNILVVIIFTSVSSGGGSVSFGSRVKSTLMGFLKNPIIIALLIAMPINLLGIGLPQIIYKPIDYLAVMSTPVALIGIGAALDTEKLKSMFGISVWAALVKTVIMPAIFVPIAIWMGFRNTELGIIAILFAAPSAVSSYSTAKAMGGDADLAASGILMSTAMSSVSILVMLFVLRAFSFI